MGVFKMSLLTKNCWESMEKELNSSGTFPWIFVIADSSRDPEWFANTEHRSCQCSTTSIGQEKFSMEFVFRIQKSQGLREDILAGTLDVPDEVVWTLQLQT